MLIAPPTTDETQRLALLRSLDLLTELAGNAQREIQHREAAVHARQQVDSLQAVLAQRVAERTAELQRSEAALARLNREQGLMLDNDLVGIVKLRQRRIVWHDRAWRTCSATAPARTPAPAQKMACTAAGAGRHFAGCPTHEAMR